MIDQFTFQEKFSLLQGYVDRKILLTRSRDELTRGHHLRFGITGLLLLLMTKAFDVLHAHPSRLMLIVTVVLGGAFLAFMPTADGYQRECENYDRSLRHVEEMIQHVWDNIS